jgi:hypothetical protein
MNSDTSDDLLWIASIKYGIGQVPVVKNSGFCCRIFIRTVDPERGNPMVNIIFFIIKQSSWRCIIY